MVLEMILAWWFVLFILVAVAEILQGGEGANRRERWPANLALFFIIVGLSTLVPLSGYVAGGWAESGNLGLLHWLNVGGVSSFIVSYLAMSFWNYIVHFALHKVSFLWRFHKVHHSDTSLDVTTTFRSHPIMSFMLPFITVIWIVVLGLSPLAIILHGIIVIVLDITQHMALQIPKKVDHVLSPFIITPSLHHIHHSDFIKETNSNYGNDLVLWDRLFRTYTKEPFRSVEEFSYGLKQYPESRASNLDELLKAPFTKDPFG